MSGLAQREAEVLADATELYLATGVPVGSKTLAGRRHDRLSPASIRNVLAELEAGGYLEQPHTSAGRIPTPAAIRWWLQQQDLPPQGDAGIDTSGLEHALHQATDDSAAWLLASHFLSEVTHQLGVVAVHPWSDTGLKHIRFVRLTERRVLAILVAADGNVRERVSRVPEPYSQTELDAATQYFNRQFAGWTLRQIRRELVHRIDEERAAYDLLLERVLVLYHCGLLELQDSGQIFIQGADHLAAELAGAHLSETFARIQRKESWLRLLSPPAADSGDEVVRLGSELTGAGQSAVRVQVGLGAEQLPAFSLIAADCAPGESSHVAVAIFGPTRMEYRRAVCAVVRVRDLLAESPRQN